jgi:hypothetical protein
MYVTVSTVKRYLGITATTDDVLIAELIAAAQGLIEQYTGRVFEAGTDSTRYFDAVRDIDGATLYLDYDLCAITTVTNGDSVAVSSSEYTTRPRNATPYYAIQILPSAAKTWTYTTDHEDAISIVGRWAYSTAPSADIRQACTRLSAYLYRQKDNANDLDRALVVGNATVLPGQIPEDIRVLLRPYRRVV